MSRNGHLECEFVGLDIYRWFDNNPIGLTTIARISSNTILDFVIEANSILQINM